jgi:hypothetical protein
MPITAATIAALKTEQGAAQSALSALSTAETALAGSINALVADAPVLSIVAVAARSAVAGTPITPVTLAAAGGTGAYTYTLGAGAPAWASLSGATISGTPPSAGTFVIPVNVTDSSTPPQMASASITVNVSATTPPPPPPPPPSTGLVQGSYNGAANVAGNAAWGKEVGLTPGLYSEYLAGDSWTDMVGANGSSEPWVIGQLEGKIPAGEQFVLSVPLVTAGYSSTQAALAAYAASPATLWAPHFTILAENLVAANFAGCTIRLAWEDDVFDFKSGDTASALNYAKLWQSAVTAMRAVPGAAFKFAWYFAPSYNAQTLNDSYPGDAYVDFVTLDFYDQAWATGSGAPPYNGTPFTAAQEAWLWANSYLPGQLNGLAAFAKAHGKQIGFGEWGVINRSDNHGGNDCPAFITTFLNWCVANDVAWISMFNFDQQGLDSQLSHFPNSLAAMKAWVAANG